MYIQEAYQAGQKIRKAILENKGNLSTEVYKLQQTKNKHDLSYEYLNLCLKFNILNNNEFMLKMLADDISVTDEDVRISLCLGMMSEEVEYINLQKAAEKWGVNDSTLRKAINSSKLKEGEDCYKENRVWKIKVAAMIREYGTIDE